MVTDIVESSNRSNAPGAITMSDEILAASNALRDFLYEQVYDRINAQPETPACPGHRDHASSSTT